VPVESCSVRRGLDEYLSVRGVSLGNEYAIPLDHQTKVVGSD
jgi:hypothetical protein